MTDYLNDTIYIASHRGMVGSALVRTLTKRGYQNLLVRTRAELDLLDQAATARFSPNTASIRSICLPPRWECLLHNRNDRRGKIAFP